MSVMWYSFIVYVLCPKFSLLVLVLCLGCVSTNALYISEPLSADVEAYALINMVGILAWVLCPEVMESDNMIQTYCIKRK